MVSKTITIKKEVYDLLIQLKHEDESFSDLLERLASREHPLDILESIAGSTNLGDSTELIEEIRKKREEGRG